MNHHYSQNMLRHKKTLKIIYNEIESYIYIYDTFYGLLDYLFPDRTLIRRVKPTGHEIEPRYKNKLQPPFPYIQLPQIK